MGGPAGRVGPPQKCDPTLGHTSPRTGPASHKTSLDNIRLRCHSAAPVPTELDGHKSSSGHGVGRTGEELGGNVPLPLGGSPAQQNCAGFAAGSLFRIALFCIYLIYILSCVVFPVDNRRPNWLQPSRQFRLGARGF